jgi:sugar/nucleoside kinase (ribokinase family)
VKPLSDTRYDYVAVGHVTCDVIESDDRCKRQPGGSAFYGALQAARLGLRTAILTQGVPGEIEQLLTPYRGEIDLRSIPAAHTTTLGTSGTGAARTQRVLSWAGEIGEPLEIDSSILHFAPVARETPTSWSGEAGFVGVTPQGLVREWKPSGAISYAELDQALLPERFDAAVISEHERPYCDALFAAARRRGACVAVTDGSRPATVHVHDRQGAHFVRSAPHAVALRDDLGAGDVFAAAFFVALAEGRHPLAAVSFANAAAAVRIASDGPAAIGTRTQIEALVH